LGDKAGEAVGRGNLGYSYAQMGMFDKGRATMEIALRLTKALGARRLSAFNLLNLALTHWRIGDGHMAQLRLKEAEPILERIGDTFGMAVSQSYLALSHEQLGDQSEAMRSFEKAKAALEDLGFQGFARDSLAGMARCALAQERNGEALRHASKLWDHLKDFGAAGMEFPVGAYMTCAHLFGSLGEEKLSQSAIAAGYHELIAMADRIADADRREWFLENVPEHREIREMWDRKVGKDRDCPEGD
jgi:tetratricopeptide (TPR) repeat protein